jgi:tellurite resistance protein TehA-like permease
LDANAQKVRLYQRLSSAHQLRADYRIPTLGVWNAPDTAASEPRFFEVGFRQGESLSPIPRSFIVTLLTIIFYRVLFHRPIPDKLMPTLFILIAPPAVGFIAYLKLTGALDSFARTLYFVALFFTLLLLTQLGRFAKLRFYLSWWAYSFPLAAVTIASLLMYDQMAGRAYLYIGASLLLLLTGIVTLLLSRTLRAVRKHGICVPEQ